MKVSGIIALAVLLLVILLLLTGSDQGDCVALQLLGRATARESAPVMEACGGRTGLSAGAYREAGATLVFGRAPAGTQRVRIDVAGRPPVAVEPEESERGSFYLAELGGRPSTVRATAETPAGPETIALPLG